MMYETPWPHIIEDNYFDPTLFNNMKEELVEYVKKHSSHFKANDVSKIENFKDLGLIYTNECVENSNINEQKLKLFKEHRKYNKLKTRSEVLVCYGEFSYRIHDEIENKILSVVTYVKSNSGHGTVLYDQNKNFSKQVDWQENRTLIFPAITGKTWHNYYSTKNSVRITLNIFLENDD